MEDRKTIFTPWLGSLMPGKNVGTSSMDSKGQVAGAFCLSMYKTDEQGRQCIVNSKVFKIDLDHPPKCIDIDQDADYAAFSFEKTYDYYVSEPLCIAEGVDLMSYSPSARRAVTIPPTCGLLGCESRRSVLCAGVGRVSNIRSRNEPHGRICQLECIRVDTAHGPLGIHISYISG